MFGRSNAYKRSEEYARKQEEQKKQQKHKRDSEGSGSFRVKKSAVKTSMPEIDATSETAWGDDDGASVISCLTIATQDTMKGKRGFGTLRRRLKKDVPNTQVEYSSTAQSVSSSESIAELVAVSVSVPTTDDSSAASPEMKITKAEQTIALIEVTIESQEERLDQLEDKIVANTKQGREKLQQGNKKAAVRAMKKIKMLQFEIEKISAAVYTMESQIITLESALNNAKVAAAMKNLNSSPSDQVDQIDVAMEMNNQENFDFQTEINVILSQPFQSVEMDDDKLLAELSPAQELPLAPTISTSPPPEEEVRRRPPRRTQSESTPSMFHVVNSRK
jgi:hypothetical protein